MNAIRQHKRSTQNLTRAALDGIDWTVSATGVAESDNDIRTLVEDMLRSMEPANMTRKDHQS
ncbi:hypothetical protein MKK55_01245 [Methylobacterium sp. J-059]|uniref:hypothetical protein n=1 Tax=Methylobacterium sp. J-059 TaxID=2836643 RepID=UPI001FB965BB|nr:hypothetical protein [Methylobacterium sp. J-059]MCJ2037589.1 hypothetical protein [Methylobacterium sp. J-059]